MWEELLNRAMVWIQTWDWQVSVPLWAIAAGVWIGVLQRSDRVTRPHLTAKFDELQGALSRWDDGSIRWR
jgi:hypothetical protein